MSKRPLLSSVPVIGKMFTGGETRSGTPEEDFYNKTAENLIEIFGLDRNGQITVTTEKALSVPAVWCAVNFLSATLAHLPLQHYRRDSKGNSKKQDSVIAGLLNDAANDDLTSYDFRKWLWERYFTKGRALAFIEKDESGEPINLFPLAGSRTVIKRDAVTSGRIYEHSGADGRKRTYHSSEILDLTFMLKEDGIGHYSPLDKCCEAIRSALATVLYGSKIFQNGGLPPFAVTGPMASSQSLSRAADDVASAATEAFNKGRPALALPAGHELKSLGIDPDKLLMVDFQRFLIEEIARIFQLPPAFLQDLTRMTFTNAEQQDLHLSKHVILRYTAQFEAQLDLKFFGRPKKNSRVKMYTAHNIDGLLRGDYASRMEGHAKAIQNAIKTPDEIRALEDLPPQAGGDVLLIQGATVPLGSQPKANATGGVSE